eukprot:SAG11_NODE_9715_length_886_cov_3.343075_1_plen_83_part_00
MGDAARASAPSSQPCRTPGVGGLLLCIAVAPRYDFKPPPRWTEQADRPAVPDSRLGEAKASRAATNGAIVACRFHGARRFHA